MTSKLENNVVRSRPYLVGPSSKIENYNYDYERQKIFGRFGRNERNKYDRFTTRFGEDDSYYRS